MTLTISPDVAASGSQYRACTSFMESAHTFAVINECSTKVKSQAVCAVDDEEEDREACAVPDRSFEVDVAALVDMAVVETGEDALRAEGLGGADGRDDLLGEGAALGDVLEGELHVLGDELVHDAAGDGDAGQHGGHGEGEAPGADVGEDETGDERGEEVDDERNLLGRALLNEVWEDGIGDEKPCRERGVLGI